MPYFMRDTVSRAIVAALEYIFAISAGVRGVREKFRSAEDGETSSGKGGLAYRQGWRFLHLEGNAYEMGLQHGRLLRPLVRDGLQEYVSGIRVWRMMGRKELIRRGRLLEPFIPADIHEEMRGITEGAGLSAEDVLIAHTFLESIEAIQCSCFAAYGSATLHGEMIFGRNLEFASMGVAHLLGLITFYKPDDGIPFISVAWPGICGTLTAVNLRGLCLGVLNVPRWQPVIPGMPYILMFRRMIQHASTCDEAIDILRATPRTYHNNVVLTQTSPARRAVVVEYSPDNVFVREVKSGDDFICATNHFRKLDRSKDWPDDAGRGRYPSMIRLLRQYWGTLDISNNILAHPRVYLASNLHAVVVAPEQRTIRVAMGRISAAEGPYRRLTYDESGLHLPPC